MKIFGLLAALTLGVLPASQGSVSVAYAASLIATMEGPLAAALRRDTGIAFAGEARGSRALAHLIAAGLRHPDVFVSAEPKLLKAPYVIFGSTRMVVAYSGHSPHRALFDVAARGRIPILTLLGPPDVRVERGELDAGFFYLQGEGRRILERAGMRYFIRPVRIVR